MRPRLFLACTTIVFLGLPLTATAQSTETLGTRAQGMAGAFVGMADDASAVYWNPAGLAGGAYFSLVADGVAAEAVPDGRPEGGSRSGWLLGLSMPALGLSYYRLQTTAVRPAVSSAGSRVESLSTQHVGATFVHSLFDGVAAGATVKVVRGVAAAAHFAGGTRDDLLDADLIGHGSNQFDLDIGVMATASFGSVGLVIRNVTEPGFRTADEEELRLDRQARLGGSILLLPKWKLAADIDLMTNHGVFGDVREMAVGTEAQVTRRLAARGGVRFNTFGDDGASPAMSAGGSFAIFGSVLVDAQVTGGSANAFRGWGLAARFVF